MSAALVVMETGGTVCMYVCFTGDPQNRAGSRFGQEDRAGPQSVCLLLNSLLPFFSVSLPLPPINKGLHSETVF